MASRTAIRRLATWAALVATLVSLAASAPAAADTDQYGNRLEFYDATGLSVSCNPSYAFLDPAAIPLGGRFQLNLFKNGVAWVDYFGIPVLVSAPFTLPVYPAIFGAYWPVPSPSEVPPGQYTLHVLLQGDGEVFAFLAFVFTTVSDTANIDPGLNTDCTPIIASTSASATRKPSTRVLARRVQAMRRHTDEWFERSLGARAKYPKARFCGRTVCVQRRAGATWKPITRR